MIIKNKTKLNKKKIPKRKEMYNIKNNDITTMRE